ncbi:hypothetical protein [Anaerorhabdus furcosa]|uniref:Uncharacterized protein n=1 Tax=Anaerorhabdus furcosa TaxID=118967 RepID=A0A1T4K9U6_9FIRM|nr:hypothetical protein [Anaerorhabdus furcosa]SJZ39181.1 hypothetical protein SAMN02745191_0423 [Anaerorhabdus furcosa]
MKRLGIYLIVVVMLVTVLTGCTNANPKEEMNEANKKTTFMLFDESKIYENKILESGEITAEDVKLKNMTFEKDLIIDKKVGDGNVYLDGVEVKGKLIVNGGGENSIHIENSKINSVSSNRVEGTVRIVVAETSSVDLLDIDSVTKLEVHGEMKTLSISQNATSSSVNIGETAKIKTVEINAPVVLSAKSPIEHLAIKAESKVTLESAVNLVTVSSSAQNTTIDLKKDAVVNNLGTEVKLDVSGTGKLGTVVTTDKTFVTGNVKPENTTVSTTPIQDAINKGAAATTPTPTITNTPKPATPKPTETPKSIETPKPTETPGISNPTPQPTEPPVSKLPWDGVTIDTSWYNSASTTFTLYNGAQLAGFGQLVNEGNNFAGKTINLGGDIDLNNKLWTPIGLRYARAGTTYKNEDAGSNYSQYWFYHNTFSGTLNGNNYTIKGLKVYNDSKTANDGAALFGFVSDATIKNLNFDGFNVGGESRVAVVAAYALGGSTFDGITLSNGQVYVNDPQSTDPTCKSWAVGGIVGQMWNYSHYAVGKNNATYSFQNIVVNSNVTISGEANVGSMWGSITEASSKKIGSFDASSRTEYPNWKGADTVNYTGYDSTVFVDNCKNEGKIYASYINAGSLAGWAYTSVVDIKSFENKGQVFVKNSEDMNPKIISGNTVVNSVPFYASDKETKTIVQTKEQLENALKSNVAKIEIRGTIGTDSDYTIYRVTKTKEILGATNSKIYGSFIIDVDNVKINGLEIHNQGWITGNPVDARRNAITVVSNRVEITNNKLISSNTVNGEEAISNGIVLLAGTDNNTNIRIENNEITGYSYENDNWSSTGTIFSAGQYFPYDTTNKKGSSKTVNLTLDYASIAKQNTYYSCYNDFVYTDYSLKAEDGYYKYTFASNPKGVIDGLMYSSKVNSKVELAPGNYTFTKEVTGESLNNNFVVKSNCELIVPTTANAIITNDTELVINEGGKLTGVVQGNVIDLNIPSISNESIRYNPVSEDIVVQFDLTRGFILTPPTEVDIATLYAQILAGTQTEQEQAARKLGNDIIYYYYYIEDNNQIPLMTVDLQGSQIPLMKNKFWSEYLIYKDGANTVTIPNGNIINGTMLGSTVLSNKTWLTATNPKIGTVATKWLDPVKGKSLYVDIVIVVEGKVIKKTVSVEIPNDTIVNQINEGSQNLDESVPSLDESNEKTDEIEKDLPILFDSIDQEESSNQ